MTSLVLIRPPGLIPAGAGRTCVASRRKSAATAHPRWRGEDEDQTMNVYSALGSSPLARGGRSAKDTMCTPVRLIPAGAGRTRPANGPVSRRAAHPRWRGEDLKSLDIKQPSVGSSPLARGDEDQTMNVYSALGSSPLARGGRSAKDTMCTPVRLIPAGAGRTRPANGPVSRRAAHPRWRGEDLKSLDIKQPSVGSSPLARGGLRVELVERLVDGLIPAGAGRTGVNVGPVICRRAHPRWRGEDHYVQGDDQGQRGSSPLARGGRGSWRSTCLHGGLIPAGAGRTGCPRRW